MRLLAPLAAVLALIAGQALAGGPWYLSNAAQNAGWANGSDSNSCLTRLLPCATVTHVKTLSSAGDVLIINPTTTPYKTEIDTGSGYLDMGTLGTIEGDPTLYGNVSTPNGTEVAPTLRSNNASTSQIINVPTAATSRTIAMVNLDGESKTSMRGINPNTMTGTLTMSQLHFENLISYLVLTPGGTGSYVLDRAWVDTTATGQGGTLFAWAFDTHSNNISVTGGHFQTSSNNSIYFSSATLGNVSVGADVNGTLPLFDGTTLFPIQFTGATNAGNVSLYANMTGTHGVSIQSSGTFTSLHIGGTYTGQTPLASIAVTGVTVPGGGCIINPLTWEGGQSTGMLQLLDENITGCVVGNAAGTVLTLDQDQFNLRGFSVATLSTPSFPLLIQNITCNFPLVSHANGPRVCGGGAGDGWTGDGAVNSGPSTAHQPVGSTVNNALLDQAWTTYPTNAQIRAPSLMGVDFTLTKTGSPTGNLTLTLQSDTAGAPSGTVLATSSTTIAASSLTGSDVLYHFLFSPVVAIAAGTKYHAVLAWSGTPDATNYPNIAETGLTCGGGCVNLFGGIKTSTNPVGTWTADSTKQALFQPDEGWYAATANPTYSNITCTYTDASDTREKECINSGPNNGITVKALICTNCNLAVVVKDALGTSTISGSFWTSASTGATATGYAKGSTNVSFINDTCINRGAANGGCFELTDDQLNAGDPVNSTGAIVKNDICRAASTSFCYYLQNASQTFAAGGADYNDINSANAAIEKIAGTTWAAWQGLGYDTHSVQCDPNLPNESTPTTAADVTPPAGNSCVLGRGSNQTANAPTDLTGATFSTTPSLGAVMVTALCQARALLGVGC